MTSSFRRFIAPINPLAIEQSNSKPRLNMGMYSSGGFMGPDLLPAKEVPSAFGIAHFNGEKDMYPNNYENPAMGLSIPKEQYGRLEIKNGEIPKVCTRNMDRYQRCVLINGKNKCEEEGKYFMATCPPFAQDDIYEGKLFNAKAVVVQRQEYKDAMEVSSYNKGRTIADIDAKATVPGGSARGVRPDSLWIDDRYADVTQEEIEAAKARVKARNAAKEAANPKQDAHGHKDAHNHGKGHH